MEFLQNLGTTEYAIAGAAVFFLIWKFYFNGSTNMNEILAKLKGSPVAPVAPTKVVVNAQGQQVVIQPPSPAPVSGTTLVADWEKFYAECEVNGLTEATAKLDEIWPSLNPKKKSPPAAPTA